MEGQPLLRAAAACLVFLLLALPLRHLTGRTGTPASAAAAATATDAAASVQVALDFEVPPRRVTLSIPSQQAAPPATFTPAQPGQAFAWNAPLPRDGADVQVEAEWPDARRHALTVTLSAAGFPAATRTFWSSGPLRDVLPLAPASSTAAPAAP